MKKFKKLELNELPEHEIYAYGKQFKTLYLHSIFSLNFSNFFLRSKITLILLILPILIKNKFKKLRKNLGHGEPKLKNDGRGLLTPILMRPVHRSYALDGTETSILRLSVDNWNNDQKSQKIKI